VLNRITDEVDQLKPGEQMITDEMRTDGGREKVLRAGSSMTGAMHVC
jgi:hypothetical protein